MGMQFFLRKMLGTCSRQNIVYYI